MNIARGWAHPLAGLRGVGLTLLAMGIFCPLTAMSQAVSYTHLTLPTNREV